MKQYRNTSYYVTEDGLIFSSLSNIFLKPQLSNKGYHRVHIGGTITAVHRMVAETFVKNPDNKPFVNHKDLEKANNRVENLEWVTAAENSAHAKLNGCYRRGADVNTAVLSEDDVIILADLFRGGATTAEIARIFNVTHATVTKLRKGQTWAYLNLDFSSVIIRNTTNVKKLSGDDIPVIRELFKTKTNAEISRVYNVAPATIRHIRLGKTWVNY